MSKTDICWATDSWNPITGCSHAGSPGCDHCYARRMAKRLAGRCGYPEAPHEFDVTAHRDRLGEPSRWKKPRVVFVCSMGDLFHENLSWYRIAEVYDAMGEATESIFLVLTKRPGRARDFDRKIRGLNARQMDPCYTAIAWPLPNVWLGVTVETQEQMWRLHALHDIPGTKHFVSIEPCLGPVDLTGYLGQIDGVIVGGESGPGARPTHPDWARSIRDQCVAAGVAYTFKQHGEWMGMDYDGKRIAGFGAECFRWSGCPMPPFLPGESGKAHHRFDAKTGAMLMGKRRAGRELDGKVWDQFPWELLREAT